MVKIAMWSGPRNLSTAMMYAFAARGDCAVMDEPFYAASLKATGMAHPMDAEILAAHETDPGRVAATCAGPVPDGARHLYMKHMPHHMQPGFPLDWAADCVNIHLIRHPARVIASYGAKHDEVTLEHIGAAHQLRLWEALPGPVIDSAEIRADPRVGLTRLCALAGIPFTEAMLHWPAGPKPFDGIWARHWYNAVHRSTGFAGPEGPLPRIDGPARALLDEAMPYYTEMKAAAGS